MSDGDRVFSAIIFLRCIAEFDAGFLHFLVRQKPDERFIVQIDDLNPISPRVAKIAPKRRN